MTVGGCTLSPYVRPTARGLAVDVQTGAQELDRKDPTGLLWEK